MFHRHVEFIDLDVLREHGAFKTSFSICGRLRVGKENLHVAPLVGAAMCLDAGCGSHDRWP